MAHLLQNAYQATKNLTNNVEVIERTDKIMEGRKMLRKMMQPKLKGHIIEINLSKWGYANYIVECSYYFNKAEGKYSLSMWLNRSDIGDRMRLSSKKVDTQYISGTKETIIENICRIVYQAANVADESGKKYFDPFVERYEYELMCFEKGNELVEKERMEGINDNKE